MRKVNLCPACAKAKGVNDPTGFTLPEILNKMGVSEKVEQSPGLLKCPSCGFTQADFKRTARFGCSECYDVFQDQLLPMLKSMHKGTMHTGRVPARFRTELLLKRQIESLQGRLTKAVEKEAFEEAASLRDEIRQIDAEVKKS